MGRTIDITSKLSTEKPKIGFNNKFYFVKDDVKTVMEVTKLSEQGDLSSIIKAMELTLGKDQCKDMDLQGMSMKDLLVVFTAINATIMDMSYEDAEKRFQNGQ